MFKSIAIALALLLAVPNLAPLPVAAASKKTEKKTAAKTPQKQPRGKGVNGYSPEERKKMLDYARKVCRKEFGAGATVHSIDYRKLRVYCFPAGA